MPLTFLYLLVLLGAVVFLAALIQVGVISIAFEKLGLSPQTGMLLLLGSLIGSGINIPVLCASSSRAASKPACRRHRCHGDFRALAFREKH